MERAHPLCCLLLHLSIANFCQAGQLNLDSILDYWKNYSLTSTNETSCRGIEFHEANEDCKVMQLRSHKQTIVRKLPDWEDWRTEEGLRKGAPVEEMWAGVLETTEDGGTYQVRWGSLVKNPDRIYEVSWVDEEENLQKIQKPVKNSRLHTSPEYLKTTCNISITLRYWAKGCSSRCFSVQENLCEQLGKSERATQNNRIAMCVSVIVVTIILCTTVVVTVYVVYRRKNEVGFHLFVATLIKLPKLSLSDVLYLTKRSDSALMKRWHLVIFYILLIRRWPLWKRTMSMEVTRSATRTTARQRTTIPGTETQWKAGRGVSSKTTIITMRQFGKTVVECMLYIPRQLSVQTLRCHPVLSITLVVKYRDTTIPLREHLL